MTQKNPAFVLNDKELKFIQISIQTKISHLSRLQTFENAEEAFANHKKVQELMQVLDTLNNRKT